MLYENVIDLLEKYTAKYSEKDASEVYELAMNNKEIVSRSNTEGHVTASGLVLHGDKLLLIFHKKLQRYLQPGGHLEVDDKSVIEAAIKEVEEETGVKAVPYGEEEESDEIVLPIYIDIQNIPYNEKKNEKEHQHYDFMFLLKADNSNVDLKIDEVEDFKWVSLDYDFKEVGLTKAVEKIKSTTE